MDILPIIRFKFNDYFRDLKKHGGLGFRDLECFNKALLAKQVWRIITRPSSLLVRVLKSRYLKDEDIMEYKLKGNVSYVWRSICWSRDLISQGIRWKIGNGEKVKICKDACILGLCNGKCTPRPIHLPLLSASVAQFVSANGEWNEDLLKAYFLNHEVQAMLQVPPPRPNRVDRRFWFYDEKGVYSVNSGYKVGMGFFASHDNQSAHGSDTWSRLIWKLIVPPKVKIFLWRLYHDFIPIEANLYMHHVPMSGSCTNCEFGWATTTHGLIFCPKAKALWKDSRFWHALKKCKSLSIFDIECRMRDLSSKVDYEEWAMLIWDIWNHLCRIKHEEHNDVRFDVDRSLSLLCTFKEAANQLDGISFLQSLAGERFWKSPETNVFRVDVDAAFDTNNKHFGVGAIVLDWRGKAIAASAIKITEPHSVFNAEVEAIRFGALLCIEEKIGPFRIFTDSLLAAHHFHEAINHEVDPIEELAEVFTLMQQGVVLSVSHIFRSANEAAHALAQHAAYSSCSAKWTTDFPSWLLSIISADYSMIN